MKALALVLGAVFQTSGVLAASAQPEPPRQHAPACSVLSGLPPLLVENRGVVPEPVAFYAEGAGNTVFFTPGGVTFRLEGEGRDAAAIDIPTIQALVGITIHTAFVTLHPRAPSGIYSISNPVAFTITR